MTVTLHILAALVGLLSLAAGIAKLMLVPDEVAFHTQFGFVDWQLMCFGLLQAIGAVLVVLPRTRRHGALLVLCGFVLSSLLLAVDGNLGFAAVSLLPVLVAGLVAWRAGPASRPDTAP